MNEITRNNTVITNVLLSGVIHRPRQYGEILCLFQHMYDYHCVKRNLMECACVNIQICLQVHVKMDQFSLHPIVHSKAKIVCNFGLSECNRVKIPKDSWLYLGNGHYRQTVREFAHAIRYSFMQCFMQC